jgi:hypothetical protein
MEMQIPSQTNKVWLVELFRLSIFFDPTYAVSGNWWQEIVGDAPDVSNSQPKLGFKQDDGRYKDGKLILSTNPGRADWVYIPAFDYETNNLDHQRLPEFIATLHDFVNIANRVLDLNIPIIRIALGVILHIPVKDRIEGYRELIRYLPDVKIDPVNSSDFLYQINKRRKSEKIADLFINRLTNWSVAIGTLTKINFLSPIDKNLIVEEHFYSRLEMDINTSQEYSGGFSKEQTIPLFLELTQLSAEIAEKGLIP